MVEQDQQKLIKIFRDTIRDENKLKVFANFLELIQNDKLQTNLDNFEELQQRIKEVETEHNNIADIFNDIKTTQKEYEEQCKQINNFFERVFEPTKNDNDEIIKPSLKQEIDILYENLKKLYDPATAKGLSEAYADEKKDIQKSVTFWNWIFSVSIFVFLGAFAVYFCLSFQQNFTYVAFLRALPFWIFSGFFTFYSTKQIAEYKRMASEYAHKETLNRTYIGYKNQVDKTDSEELNEQLLKIMLDSAELNPSKVLASRGEIPSTSLLQQIKDALLNTKANNMDENLQKNVEN